ncbi:MAG: hypothetical protein Solivirus2_67 [Solivirus sp.]|uniref:Uncharacterized protein n=1 Tax=Solivirus sp. TaxID=2487772 RepID=A0A3G5AFK6_9VIRU|nr:MAG: hypothetical protein Solivirus2_67 [Solivirus sp.]
MFASPSFERLESDRFSVLSIEFRYELAPILIFNLPSTILVQISGIYLSSEIFCYFNPLLMNKKGREKVRFYDTDKREFVDTFPCLTVQSSLLQDVYESLSKQSIFYPSGATGHIISYETYQVYPAIEGQLQMFDILNKLRRSHPSNFNPSIVFPQATSSVLPVFDDSNLHAATAQLAQGMQYLYSTLAANAGLMEGGEVEEEGDDEQQTSSHASSSTIEDEGEEEEN